MLHSNHWTDDNGNPDGGQAHGCGFAIAWQRGAMVDSDGNRIHQSGAFVEDIISAAKDRLEYFQATRFACDYNAEAIGYLDLALEALAERTSRRKDRGVEGTHQP